MLSIGRAPLLRIDPEQFARSYNSEPFPFEHNLSGNNLFSLGVLYDLARSYAGSEGDYFVAGGAKAPGTRFYSVSHSRFTPHEAIARIESVGQRVLLKRPERYDPRFAQLQKALYAQIAILCGVRHETPVRLDSSIFITSAATITPFHFDPEITFFFQIEGTKVYHLYSPQVVTEEELEKFYKIGALDIGQLDLTGRDPARETVYVLEPNAGFHQPENTPHWVQTGAELSISYAISLETASTRRIGRTRAFNHYARKLGFPPQRPGGDIALDAKKAAAMQLAMPLRRCAATTLRRITRR